MRRVALNAPTVTVPCDCMCPRVAGVASALPNPMQNSAKGRKLRVGYWAETMDPFYEYDAETETRSGGFYRIDTMMLDVLGVDVEWVSLGTTNNGIQKIFNGLMGSEQSGTQRASRPPRFEAG